MGRLIFKQINLIKNNSILKLEQKLVRVLLAGLLILVLTACGNQSNPNGSTFLPPASTSGQQAGSTPEKSPVTGNFSPVPLTTARATNGVQNKQETPVSQSETNLTAVRGERDVVRTFTDAQGRPIKLVYGRGSGHSGDFGWAHILGKHVNGIWYDGGTITTFPQAVGTRTPEAVVELINQSLQDKNPDNAGGSRRSYSFPVTGTNKDIFTVVGGDGTIITSYPVPHGSKDLNA